MRHIGFVALLIFTLVAAAVPRGQRRGGQNRTPTPFDAGPRVFDTTEYRIRVVNVAGGLSYPYCLAFLPDGSILVAELEGRLRRIRDGVLLPEPIGGIPKVYYAAGQAGLMDIALHPNFAQNHLVYFTYNKPGEKGATMAVARGVFAGTQLTGVSDVFVADAWRKENGHLSARIAFGRDGMLYMTVADHNQVESAQKGSDDAGKILRLRDDGTAPADNPFAGRPGYRPEIFAIGNRNPHGIAVHPDTGEIWENEHGDEVNILKPGANYGWPYV